MHSKMRCHLQLAAVILITATPIYAQFHFPQLSHKDKDKDREDVSWLAPYATPDPGGRAEELLHDSRFKPFIRDHLTAPQTFWNQNESLHETIAEFLGVPGQVVLDDNRFLSVDGSVPQFSPSRGLIFVDLGTVHPLVVFAATDWVKEDKTPSQSGAEYTLWVFTNHSLHAAGDDDPNHIPDALKRAITRWTNRPLTEGGTAENITTTILVDPDGTPHQVPTASLGLNSAQSSEPKAQSPALTPPPPNETKK
jgi:hypothetical protein